TKAIASIVGATQAGSPLADLFAGFGNEAAANVAGVLTRGITLGQNPRTIAGDVANALGVSRARALTINRTEMLRAYRGANQETYRANSDVVQQWRWTADKSARTCAACLAMDGQLFNLDVDMGSHPNCRCSPAPVTRSWSDILADSGVDLSGLDDLEPPAPQSGADWFDQQDESTQRAILGNAKYAAYQNGDFALSDIVAHSHDPDWGHSIYEKPLKDLVKQ
ncbi:MAG: phage minor head protein, partial [Ktedonobacteraceae bacterium]